MTEKVDKTENEKKFYLTLLSLLGPLILDCGSCFIDIIDALKVAFYSLLMYVHTYDPLEIGDAARGRLQKGLLTGLDTLTNHLEPEISCTDDNWIVFNTDLGVKNVGIIYEWNYKFLFEFSGLIWCCIDKVDLDLEVQNTMIDGCVIFKLTKLIFIRLGDLKFGLTGLGVLNKLVASIINLLCRIWREDIKAKIESQLKVLLKSQLGDITNSVNSFLTV